MIGKWHISEERKRFCELASGLGKICCFQERGRKAEPPCAVGREQVWCWMWGYDPAGASSHLQAGSARSGWVVPWDCPNSTELALIFITFLLGLYFFLQLRKSLDAVREGWEGQCSRPAALCGTCSPVLLSWQRQNPQGLQSLAVLPLELLPVSVGSSWLAGAWRQRGHVPMAAVFPSDPIHLLLPGTFCCSDQWCEFHDLCTCMNFAVHPSGSSAFTFTVYFLVCLIRWLCWLYLNSLYFYAGF